MRSKGGLGMKAYMSDRDRRFVGHGCEREHVIPEAVREAEHILAETEPRITERTVGNRVIERTETCGLDELGRLAEVLMDALRAFVEGE